MSSANPQSLPENIAAAYFTGVFKMLLVSAAPSEANLDAFAVRSDITNEVPNSGSYSAGGAAVTCTVGAYDAANNRVPVTFGSPAAFTAATIGAVGGWIYKSIGTAGTDQLVTYVDFGGLVSSTNDTFTVTISAPLYVNR